MQCHCTVFKLNANRVIKDRSSAFRINPLCTHQEINNRDDYFTPCRGGTVFDPCRLRPILYPAAIKVVIKEQEKKGTREHLVRCIEEEGEPVISSSTGYSAA
ncbi:hypothetical protein PUN28_003246 [Cardiocondyla obscurior]|uniref:Uncharacterized protein n=1 Tax=Cardiocondyla obscurior TaxID=286306 RepID=A0AAW2GI21_9HYME